MVTIQERSLHFFFFFFFFAKGINEHANKLLTDVINTKTMKIDTEHLRYKILKLNNGIIVNSQMNQSGIKKKRVLHMLVLLAEVQFF